MAKDRKETGGIGGIEGMLKGLTDFVEKLGELADKGEQLSKAGEIQFGDQEKGTKGVCGFSFKMGIGEQGVKVEPFGNVRKDKTTGEAVVQEIREPLVDIFEEDDHVLIVAEMPGIGAKDIRIEVHDDVLNFYAEKGDKKYRKEILLPGSFEAEKVSLSCKNGIVEIKCRK